MHRKWINQPSTLQPFHHLHGINVLADTSAVIDTRTDNPRVNVYFLEGSEISQFVPASVLSTGWTGTPQNAGDDRDAFEAGYIAANSGWIDSHAAWLDYLGAERGDA